MTKIRYADLPQGLHAHVRPGGGRPVIYLLPGLSPAQRRDVLRRLIRTSRQGHGPRLRATGVAFAVARDVAKSTARNGLAAVRCHPAGSAVLAAFVTAAMVCYALFVTVSVQFSPGPTGPPALAGGAPSRSQGAGGSARSPGGRPSAPTGRQPAVTVQHGGSPASPAGSGSGSGSRPSGSGPSGRASSLVPLPTGTWSAPGDVLPSASPGPSAAGSSSPSPAPSAGPPPASPGSRPPGTPGGLCLQVGPLGVCISG